MTIDYLTTFFIKFVVPVKLFEVFLKSKVCSNCSKYVKTDPFLSFFVTFLQDH